MEQEYVSEKYEVRPIVCDSAIYRKEDDHIMMILNSRANALTIMKIMDYDERNVRGMSAAKIFKYVEVE